MSRASMKASTAAATNQATAGYLAAAIEILVLNDLRPKLTSPDQKALRELLVEAGLATLQAAQIVGTANLDVGFMRLDGILNALFSNQSGLALVKLERAATGWLADVQYQGFTVETMTIDAQIANGRSRFPERAIALAALEAFRRQATYPAKQS